MYETISIVEPIKGMILSCPFLLDFFIEINPIGFENYTQEESIPEQSYIDINSARVFSRSATIDGDMATVMDKIISFSFLQLKYPDDDSAVRFKENFPDWIDELHTNQKAPRFSYERKLDGSLIKYNWKDELIEATNPQYIGKNASGINVYNVDIHVRYIIKYESKGRCY